MKQMMQVLNSGGIVAITPDGPLGPPNQVKPGIIQMARATGGAIVPLTFGADRKKVFASWDEFNLPYPFSRIVLMFGAPLYIDAEESDQTACRRLKRTLDELTQNAEQQAKKK